jgi:hypothetical protein
MMNGEGRYELWGFPRVGLITDDWIFRYMAMYRPPVKDICLNFLEELWINRKFSFPLVSSPPLSPSHGLGWRGVSKV